MLYVFFGTDTTNVRKEAFDFLDTLQNDDTEVVKITHTDYVSGMIAELAQGEGLFGTIQIVVLDTLSEDEIVESEILNNLDLLKDSSNHFILIEGSYDAARKKKVTKYAEKISEKKAGKKERFNVFSLTDAFLRKDKKSLWLLLSNAWKEGVSNEEIIGILFWQIKILRLVSKTGSPEEAGQKPFVYQKAKQSLQNFKEGELDELSKSIVSIYHDGHLGRVDLNIALEKWVLDI